MGLAKMFRAIVDWFQLHRPATRKGTVLLAAGVCLAVAAAAIVPALLTGGDGKKKVPPTQSPTAAPPAPIAPVGDTCAPPAGPVQPWTWLGTPGGAADPRCVGFATGPSAVLAHGDPDIAAILDLVGQDNRSVEQRGKPTVTVVAMLPLTGDAQNRPIDVLGGVYQLRGIHTALREHNGDGSDAHPGTLPLVRLVVADVGAGFSHAEAVAAKVIESGRLDPSFAGVVGLNQGRGTTSSAISLFDEAKIPMLATTATSDDLTAPQAGRRMFAWYWRIAAKNSAEAELIVKFLREVDPATKAPRAKRPFIVFRDKDAYSTNLAGDVQSAYYASPPGTWPHARAYQGQDRLALQAEMAKAVEPACAEAAAGRGYDAVVFTGRADDLRSLSAAMDERGCKALPIVAGDDLAVLESAKTMQRPGAAAALSFSDDRPLYFVDYAPTTKELWPDAPDVRAHAFFAQFAAANPGVLPSSSSMAAYDGLMVMAAAAPKDAGAKSGDALREAVRAGLDGTCGAAAVRGATGVISFDTVGDPQQKHVVVRKFDRGNPSPVVARTGVLVGPIPECAAPARG
ncbi:hypothetical protein [Yinghuangia soli]|uniref:Leucine-binding protein domain-containing protein n=1 Tax=Yinghuangia soli TaxID=2908204 RepID=A0AA41U1K1_9ACTN|nr:hypothetical protein [Yinghuangia soli]MCF2526214.1 hypothetical protein [Yinghuangia soli]